MTCSQLIVNWLLDSVSENVPPIWTLIYKEVKHINNGMTLSSQELKHINIDMENDEILHV